MIAVIRKFPWFEVALIVGLAAALIVRPGSATQTGTPAQQGSSLLPLTSSTQPRASL
jgi:hypothetical protein